MDVKNLVVSKINICDIVIVGDNMIKSAKKFSEYFQAIYYANSASVHVNKDFDEVFESNKSRIEYLNKLFEEQSDYNLDLDGEKVFKETM